MIRLGALLTPPFDRARWEAGCGPALHVRIGNAPPAVGLDAALDALAAFLTRISTVGASYCEHMRRRETLWAETDIMFLDRGGQPCLLPCVIVARLRHEKFTDLRLHLDPSPIPGVIGPRAVFRGVIFPP